MSKQSLKIIFAGTPEFAACALKALISSGHTIVAVYTQPDKPKGRGLKLIPSAVKILAMEHQLPILQPLSLKSLTAQSELAAFNADVMVVAAYGMLLPEAVLNIPQFGCINIHPSLLPRWRGAAPIQRTIAAGDTVTGITIMQMDAGLDTGPILLQHSYPLSATATSQSLHDSLALLGGEALLETLSLLQAHQLKPLAQNNQLATYAHKISKEEAALRWEQSAVELERLIRAFQPWPIAYVMWQQQALRIWQAQAYDMEKSESPGKIVAASRNGIDIATSRGLLRLLQVQLPGGKILSCTDFFNARQNLLIPGQYFL